MIDPTTPDEDEAFNEIERLSKIKMEIIRAQKMAIHVESMNRVKKAFDEEMQLQAKTQQEVYDELRNGVIEEVAVSIEKMRGFGNDTISSFAIYIRGMKK